MRISFHGAAQTVTGSQHLIEVNGRQLLLDCGLYQGSRAEAMIRNRSFEYDARKIDAVILSHAHIDHSGNLPSLVKAGYRGPIYATPATSDLCELMLMDSARIQESDVAFYNKKAARRGEPADAEALYTEEDAAAALTLFRGQNLKQTWEVITGVRATLYEAGHILGSAMVVLDIDEGGRQRRLAFSGDIGRFGLPILRDPTILNDIDHVIMESTYGTRNHRPPEEASAEFAVVARETLGRGGKIVVPAFAVGRAQEIVYDLQKLIGAGELPAVPVFVDSPLAVNVSTVFKRHAELFDEETAQLLRTDGEVFGFKSLRYTRSVEESKAINDVKGPAVIISASGMAEAGRILHHLSNHLGDSRNTVLIVSWQAPNTLGRRLAEGAREVKIFGEWHPVRARVATINGLSGHAGRDLLIQWATALKPRVRDVFLVHGEPESSAALKEALQDEGMTGVHAPALHETVEV
ncbi:MAG TPA: MBL fold metallo-hydrolase [Anaerolineales bacterium]|nr:MBL fold metallo-hydrolase [Anaerolineales bacterium]